MAGFALYLLVFSFQGKSRLGMVKTDLLPGVRIMAPLALFAQVPFVLVILDMAGVAVTGCFTEFGFKVA